MKTFMILSILGSALIFSGLSRQEAKKPDYTLELNKDVIHIETKNGKQYIIDPDSLQAFIINDNI